MNDKIHDEEDYDVYMEVIIKHLNNQINEATLEMDTWDNDIENISLIDIAMNTETIENATVRIFTQRFGFNIWNKKGQYLNVVMIHSKSIRENDEDIYMPYEYDIKVTDIGLKVESKYEVKDYEKSLIHFLQSIGYNEIFNKSVKDITYCFNKMGYSE